jgi:hypothetical protein
MDTNSFNVSKRGCRSDAAARCTMESGTCAQAGPNQQVRDSDSTHSVRSILGSFKMFSSKVTLRITHGLASIAPDGPAMGMLLA